jgi:hypothetical protein
MHAMEGGGEGRTADGGDLVADQVELAQLGKRVQVGNDANAIEGQVQLAADNTAPAAQGVS